MTAALLMSGFLVPLALALAVALAAPGWTGAVLRLLPLAPLPALWAAAMLPVPAAVAEPWLLMGAGFGLDDVSRVFLGFTAVLWSAAGWAATGWLPAAVRPRRFAACFLLAMAGNLGLIVATDAPGFYAFFALMSFSAYGLVIHSGSPKALTAGKLYIGFVIAGELALFAGLALAAAGAGALELSAIRAAGLSDPAAALLIAGFAAKLGVMPLHFWLPPAHGAAPAPASAVLSGAMIKAGLFGLMATLPLGTAVLWDHGTVLLAAGLLTVTGAAILGAREADPKAVLGFSSVGQMGLMALGLGTALKSPGAWAVIAPVLVLLAAHHALAKGALFLGAGAVLARPDARWRIGLGLALVVPAAALAGLPFTGGGIGKEALKAALGSGNAGWTPWLLLGVTVATIATTLLMARFGFTLARAAEGPSRHGAAPAGALPCLVLIALTVALAPALPVVAPGLALPAAATQPALWPVAVALALALVAWLLSLAATMGPGRFWQKAAAPGRVLKTRIIAALLRLRRAVRVTGRRLPAMAAARARAGRLGPAAPAVLLAGIIALGTLPWPVPHVHDTNGPATQDAAPDDAASPAAAVRPRPLHRSRTDDEASEPIPHRPPPR